MDIKPSPAILSALASLQQGGTGPRAPIGAQQGTAVQTVEAVPPVTRGGVDIRIGGDSGAQAAPRREAPGTAPRPLQPGLGRLIDLSV